jgi:pimeloyl-ACP methyl ester carboxylesterase
MKKMQLLVVVAALTFSACGLAVEQEPMGTRKFRSQEANVEEIKFRSGKFRLVGDLRMPMGDGPYPAIIMSHGSGGATRNGAVPFSPMIEIFLRNGYAVFSWDKPGSGDSTGKFSDELTQRADILADGIRVLAEHPSIDPEHIGLWGISQAGWIMPLALDLTDDASFMIVVSGGAEDSIEQMAYQVGQVVACSGGTEEQAELADRSWSTWGKATTYEEYRQAVETLLDLPRVESYTGLKLTAEEDWKPRPRHWDSFIDPMDVIEHTTIPTLVFYGELDKNIDPVQGAEAYEEALKMAGNSEFQIVVIPGVGHILTPANTGCLNESTGTNYAAEYLETLEAWIQGLSN